MLLTHSEQLTQLHSQLTTADVYSVVFSIKCIQSDEKNNFLVIFHSRQEKFDWENNIY